MYLIADEAEELVSIVNFITLFRPVTLTVAVLLGINLCLSFNHLGINKELVITPARHYVTTHQVHMFHATTYFTSVHCSFYLSLPSWPANTAGVISVMLVVTCFAKQR